MLSGISARLILAILLLTSSVALAQRTPPGQGGSGTIVQTGKVVPRHNTMWAANGVVMDAGGAAGGLVGTAPSEIGVTNTGTPFCITDGPTSSPYHQMCFGA